MVILTLALSVDSIALAGIPSYIFGLYPCIIFISLTSSSYTTLLNLCTPPTQDTSTSKFLPSIAKASNSENSLLRPLHLILKSFFDPRIQNKLSMIYSKISFRGTVLNLGENPPQGVRIFSSSSSAILVWVIILQLKRIEDAERTFKPSEQNAAFNRRYGESKLHTVHVKVKYNFAQKCQAIVEFFETQLILVSGRWTWKKGAGHCKME